MQFQLLNVEVLWQINVGSHSASKRVMRVELDGKKKIAQADMGY